MKWFKHEVDADEGKIVAHVVRKYGLEGEARYWRLTGLLAKNFPPDKKGFFTFDLETIRKKLSQRSSKDTTMFMDHLADYKPKFEDTKNKQHPFIVQYSENHCRIKYDKIAEIKDNHTTNLQATAKKLASNLDLDKRKNKSNKKSQSVGMDSLNPVAIGSEIMKLIVDHPPTVDIRDHASDGAKIVLAQYSRAFLGDRTKYELNQLVRETLKAKEAS